MNGQSRRTWRCRLKVYLAARYDRREEMCRYAEILRELGHQVPARWLLGTHQIDPNPEKVDEDAENVPIEAAPFAQDDYEDIRDCDCLVFFSEPATTYSKRGGRHVEFGLALAWGKRVCVIGPAENVFHRLPEVVIYPTWGAFMEYQRDSQAPGSPPGA